MSTGDPDRASRDDSTPLPRRPLGGVFAVLVALGVVAVAYYGVVPRKVESPWHLVRSDPASNEILIAVLIGNTCMTFKRVDVDEASDRVTISVRSRGSARFVPKGCDDLAQIKCLTIELARPLGSRTIRGGLPSVGSKSGCS